MRKLIFFDTTLRDGEQCPGFSMTTDEKIRLALQLEKLGVDVIEAGFPLLCNWKGLGLMLLRQAFLHHLPVILMLFLKLHL